MLGVPRALQFTSFLMALGLAASAAAQESAPEPPTPPEAYYQFLMGRHYEGEGQLEQAVEAHQRAAQLDPTAAEVPAELASLYARQGRFQEAMKTAEQALRVDASNVEAHRVLGSIYATMAESRRDSAEAIENAARRAVEHLEKGRRKDGTDSDPGIDLALGRLHLKLGEPEAAASVLRGLVTRQPEIAEGYILLAQAERALGRPERAAAALEEGAETHPRLLSALAEHYERQRQWIDAAHAYERLAAVNPASSEVRLRWATALLQADDQDAARRARALLDEITAGNSPADPRALYLRSNAERRLRDFAAAEATARQVIELDPTGWTGPFALAQVFEDRYEYSRVVEVLTPVVERLESNAESRRDALTLLSHLGYAQLQTGRGADAVQTFEKARALSANPGMFDASLVQSLMMARDYARAAALARAARERPNADDLRLFQLEARALVADGRADRAVVVMRDAVAAHGEQIEAHLTLADVLNEANREAEAHRVLDETAARFPDDTRVAFQRGALFERRGKYAEAEAAFRKVLARDPMHAQALNYLGYMLAERGERLDEAISLVERALAIEPDNPAYLDSLGWAFFQQRRYDRAEPLLRRAAERLPSNSVVQEHFGDLLWALGRRGEARTAWQHAVDGDRESVDLEALRRKIRSGL